MKRRLKTILTIAGNILILFLISAALTTLGCAEDDLVESTGRVVYIDLEGGFYGIYADNGIKYDPVNIAPAFQKDSLRVRFEGKIITNQMSTHMWGTLLQITTIDSVR